MEFGRRKAAALAGLASPAPDKSPKGGVDAAVAPLLAALNSHPDLFTTSSCSGRISILSHPHTPDQTLASASGEEKLPKAKKKAGGGRWVYVSHDPADPDAVADLLFSGGGGGGGGGELVFRFEPLIVAVECRDVAAAQALVSAAVGAGFRESGITSLQKRIMVAIRCSIRMEVPLGQTDELVVSPEYVRYLVRIANSKMEANKKRTDGFLNLLRTKGLPGSAKLLNHYSENQGQFAAKETSLGSEVNLTCSLPLNGSAKPNNASPDTVKRGDGYKCNEGNIYSAIDDKGGAAFHGSSIEESYFENLEDSGCNKDDSDGFGNAKRLMQDVSPELAGDKNYCLSTAALKITGEPIEKLFLWGQSACPLTIRGEPQVLIFGGFGGPGRHARRNYSLILDHKSGLLTEIDIIESPSPRMGHTVTIIGDDIYVIGGRGGPSEILDDVWVLQTTEKRWLKLECNGNLFRPRHRHGAAAVGSKIYVFGGLNNEGIYSCMNVLDTESMQWSEVGAAGEWPCALHSHSLVSHGSKLFMFGGHDGQKALDDLYSFDLTTLKWNKEKAAGKAPSPRFSHCMFIYKNYLGIIGGCPVREHHQELALLNLQHRVWFCVSIPLLSQSLCVRSSSVVIDNDLVIVGGGASCYAFGTKFNQPMKIDLHLLESTYELAYNKENDMVEQSCDAMSSMDLQENKHSEGILHHNVTSMADSGADGSAESGHLVLQLEKKYAKLVKDILKKFGWLDLTRKVRVSQDNFHVLFPVSRAFRGLVLDEQLKMVNSLDKLSTFQELLVFSEKKVGGDNLSLHTALEILLSCGGSFLKDELSCSRKVSKSPQTEMREVVCPLLERKGMPSQLLEQLPTRWENLGDIVVLPKTCFKDPLWDSIGDELWPLVAKSLGAQRLARQGRIMPNGTRDSTLELLVGENGWVTHHENGIRYSLDATKCMFSSGNRSEKLRMAQLDCRNEVVVDLFAGIGYFVLPFLVKANVKLVYACEWNPHALGALRRNVHDNHVADRCIILEGDNRVTAPKGVADRVCLGLLPSSECSWATAVRALRVGGGILHIHGNVNDSEETLWLDNVVESISNISKSEGLSWDISLQHVERVKWYGPHIRHLVADVWCKPNLKTTTIYSDAHV